MCSHIKRGACLGPENLPGAVLPHTRDLLLPENTHTVFEFGKKASRLQAAWSGKDIVFLVSYRTNKLEEKAVGPLNGV